ncbi:NAD(P)-binding domain-containing protein [Shigella flexneri]
MDSLKPYLDKGDIIIDGGNTLFQDTISRNRELSAEASSSSVPLYPAERRRAEGPSIMPGGRKNK